LIDVFTKCQAQAQSYDNEHITAKQIRQRKLLLHLSQENIKN